MPNTGPIGDTGPYQDGIFCNSEEAMPLHLGICTWGTLNRRTALRPVSTSARAPSKERGMRLFQCSLPGARLLPGRNE